MIDIHCHLLPGLDDGAVALEMSVRMARMAVADGITDIVCTPHVAPGVYDNTATSIRAAVSQLQMELSRLEIPLRLHTGADAYVAPDMPSALSSGRVPSIGAGRYFLFEPPHDVLPPRLDRLAGALLDEGFVPILTHPERFSWLKDHYRVIERLQALGVCIQITAGSVTGDFGRRARYWATRLLEENMVDFIATDAHDPVARPPILSRARDAIAEMLGDAEAGLMVEGRPAAVLANLPLPGRSFTSPRIAPRRTSAKEGLVQFLQWRW